MSQSVLEEIGQQEVPRRPPEFRRRLHERLNSRLLNVHVVEFAVRVLPFALRSFFECLVGAVAFSLTGRYPKKGDRHAERNDPDR